MLDISVAKKAPSFIKDIDNTQNTDETVRVKAVLGRHKETTGEHDWLRNGPTASQTTSGEDNETSLEMLEPLSDSVKLSPSALEQLSKLAAEAVEKAEARYREEEALKQQESLTMAILETLAKGQTPEDHGATVEMGAIAMLSMPSTRLSMSPDEVEVTHYEVPAIPKSDSGSNRMPRWYRNPTLAPYTLILSAINENKRYMGPTSLPSKIYVSDVLMFQLHKDIKICLGVDFNGQSLPFMQLDGTRVEVPVVSAKSERDLDLPADMVGLYSGIES